MYLPAVPGVQVSEGSVYAARGLDGVGVAVLPLPHNENVLDSLIEKFYRRPDTCTSGPNDENLDIDGLVFHGEESVRHLIIVAPRNR